MSANLDEIKDLATRTVIRLELGLFVVKGPTQNVMEVESRVAFETVAGQLHHEGYQMVTPELYAAFYRLGIEKVLDRIQGLGDLFALEYGTHDDTLTLVPLKERGEAWEDLDGMLR